MPAVNAPMLIVVEAVSVEAEKPLPAGIVAVAVIVATPGATAVTTTEPFAPTVPSVASDVLDVLYVYVTVPAAFGFVTFGVIVTVCCGDRFATFGESVSVLMPGVCAETDTAEEAT